MSITTIEKSDYFKEPVATFGDRLEAAREAKGLTTATMAEKLGVRKKTIKNWEADGAMPRGNRIQMLAGMLNVSIVWLISGESNGTSHVAETHLRPTGVNDALGEIAQLKTTLSGALTKLEQLELRLQQLD